LCSASPLELNNVVFWWRCKYVVSLCIKKVHDLPVNTSSREVNWRIEPKAI
jgi:hypothetical protein